MDNGAFKKLDAASYDGLAEEYGRFIERLAAPLATEVCRLAGVAAGDRVLDIGCGTGIASRAAAGVVGKTGRVVGIDLSTGMLAAAAGRSEREIADGVLRFMRMDAEELAFEDGSFDAVVSLCAVLHFPRIDRALAEMRRVLRPGGTLVVSFGAGRPSTLLALADYAARRARARLRSRFRPEMRAPAPLLGLAAEELPAAGRDVLTTWAGSSPLQSLLRHVQGAGFLTARASWLGHDVRFDSSDEFWDAQLAIVTEVRARAVEADPAAIARLRQRFDAKVARVLAANGELVYPYGASFVTAVAPGPG